MNDVTFVASMLSSVFGFFFFANTTGRFIRNPIMIAGAMPDASIVRILFTLVFAKKKKPNTLDNMLATKVTSFTKQRDYDVVISRDYLTPDDHVIFIDDFLAYGNAAKGIIDLCKQSGATLEGMGFIIEKAFQDGGQYLREHGVRVESLAIIESLDNCEIKIKNA